MRLSYKLGRAFAIMLLLSFLYMAILIAILLSVPINGSGQISNLPEKHQDFIESIGKYTALIAFGTFIVSMIGTTSTILLGWRADRRQSDETRLKIQQLEIQLAEARAKSALPAPAGRESNYNERDQVKGKE